MACTYTKLILHQVGGILVEFVQQRASMLVWQMLKAPLQYSTAVWVSRQIVNVASEGADETQAVGRYPFNQFLNNLNHSRSVDIRLQC